jgi:hypothetical protein
MWALSAWEVNMPVRHVIISGLAQSGRTTAAVAMANAMHDQGVPTGYVTPFGSMVPLLREKRGLRSQIVTRLSMHARSWGCLIVDDVGRIEDLPLFVGLAVMRVQTYPRASIVWVVDQTNIEDFRRLLTRVDLTGYGVDAGAGLAGCASVSGSVLGVRPAVGCVDVHGRPSDGQDDGIAGPPQGGGHRGDAPCRAMSPAMGSENRVTG